VIAFLVAVVVTAAGAIVTAGWHVLSKHDPPTLEAFDIGLDILVGALVMQITFIPGSQGQEAAVRWAGVAVILLLLFAMAVIIRYRGYEPQRKYRRRSDDWKPDEELTVYPLKSSAVRWTASIGCCILCTFWVLNEHIDWVLSALKGLSH
jgi:hypothetical protein